MKNLYHTYSELLCEVFSLIVWSWQNGLLYTGQPNYNYFYSFMEVSNNAIKKSIQQMTIIFTQTTLEVVVEHDCIRMHDWK